LISETGRARIQKLSLNPEKDWLQLSTFSGNLPGLPDKIRASGRGTFWVAMSQARHQNISNMLDEYASQPQMREMVAMMSSMEQILNMGEKYGLVVELNTNGEIIRTLQDPTGNQIAAVSEAHEHDGFLYLGSYDRPYVSRVALTKAFHVERFLQKIKSTCRATKINIVKLRTVLRRLIAIAEFRRALLNAKKRREEEERAAQQTKMTTTASITSVFTDLVTTTREPYMDNTTASQNGTQNVTESMTTQLSQRNISLSNFTTTVGEIATSTTDNPEVGGLIGETTTAAAQASVTTTGNTTSVAKALNSGADTTETDGPTSTGR